jgi:hypothetical protein
MMYAQRNFQNRRPFRQDVQRPPSAGGGCNWVQIGDKLYWCCINTSGGSWCDQVPINAPKPAGTGAPSQPNSRQRRQNPPSPKDIYNMCASCISKGMCCDYKDGGCVACGAGKVAPRPVVTPVRRAPVPVRRSWFDRR